MSVYAMAVYELEGRKQGSIFFNNLEARGIVYSPK
jgi:hypothetical protein